MTSVAFLTRPRRLAWPRTSPFHGGNTGSNPVGDANFRAVPVFDTDRIPIEKDRRTRVLASAVRFRPFPQP